MADDAGALLVRSGLVSSNALDDARARVASVGGTLGEQLVASGAIADEDLTDFYRSRLLVPQVNPNLLARLTPQVVATIPGDMAIELRAIPVSIDGDNNLTVAMSDPSDRHAVDEIAFFTGAYVVRAVATQMQIAWCLAHYYGHVTALGQRLLRVAQSEPVKAASPAARPRTKGLTGKVNATRHRAIAPITGPVDVLRPSSGQLDLHPLERASAGAATGASSAVGGRGGAALQSASQARSGGALGLSEAALADMTAAAAANSDATLTVPGFVRPNPLMVANAIPEAMDLMTASGALPMVALPALDARDPDDASARHLRSPADLAHRPTKPGIAPPPGAPLARPGATPAPAPGVPAAQFGAMSAAGATAARPGVTSAAGAPAQFGAASAAGPAAARPGVTPAPAAGAPAQLGAAAAAGATAARPGVTPAPAAGAPAAQFGAMSAAGATAARSGVTPAPAAAAPTAQLGAAAVAGATAARSGITPAPAAAAPALLGAPASGGGAAVARAGAMQGPAADPWSARADATHDPEAGTPTARMTAIPDPASSAAATHDPESGTPTARMTAMPDPTSSATRTGAIHDPGSGAAVARIAVTPAARAAAGPASAAGAAWTPVPTAGPNTPTLVPDGGLTAPRAAQAGKFDDEPPRSSGAPSGPAAPDGIPEKPRARSVSGEIRVPVRRAPSIKPPLGDEIDDQDEPLIMIEMREEDDDVTGPRPLPVRRRPIAKSDPPELYARAGEVDLKAGDDRVIDADEPRIVVDEDAFAPPTGRIEVRADRSGSEPLITTIDVVDDADTGALIHDRVVDRAPAPSALDGFREDDEDSDTGEIDIVMLDAPKKPRPERRTEVGIGPTSSSARPAADPDATGPTLVDPHGAAASGGTDEVVGDATSVDLQPAPPGEDTTSDQLAAPPSPASDADTNPHVVAPPPFPAAAAAPPAPRSGAIQRAVIVEDVEDVEDDEDDDGGTPRGRHTSEMTAAELDDAIPERRSEIIPELLRRRLQRDAVDDGWGPPGTTIPPPLLGAIPGSEDDDETANANAIPMPNVDSSPLLVGPAPAFAGDPGGRALARALEDATARAIDVIRELEHTQSRDEIIEVMIAHLIETHHRAGFFVTKHTVAKDAGELALFAMMPRPVAMPSATLRLDRPSTLQDVVGTRLPYRGPMHDDASRAFLISVLGACPPEILLVPVTVRERVVGVLFGEHRQRHTFDDQLAVAARAAGMALERILRSRRG